VCEGTDIRWVSCDCGEVKYLYNQSIFCNLERTEREETLPNGQTCIVSVAACKDCGLVTEHLWYQELNEATCTTVEAEILRVIFDGQQIASGRRLWTEGEGSGQHMQNIPGETVELSDGLCGVTLKTWTCFCGERSSVWMEESDCRWAYNSELSTDTVSVYYCRVCGAVRKNLETGVSEKEDCTVIHNFKTVIEVDEKEIYSYTSAETWIQHDYQTTEVDLEGESCEDGVYLKKQCRDCGKVYEQYVDYHAEAERIAVKLEGFCADSLIQTNCACGERKNRHFPAPLRCCFSASGAA
jgi:hypothetical protein